MPDFPRPTFTLSYVRNPSAAQANVGTVHLTIRRPNSNQTDIVIDTPYGTSGTSPETFRRNYEALLTYHQIRDEDCQRLIYCLFCFLHAVHLSTADEPGITNDVYFSITDYNPHATARMDRDFLLSELDTTKRIANGSEATEECPICFEMLGGEEHVNELRCGHMYHSECIVTWLYSRMNCPICRFTDI